MIISSLNEKGNLFKKNDLNDDKVNFCSKDSIFVISEILNLFLAENFPN